MKNVVEFENSHFPWQLEAAIKDFVDDSDDERDHASLQNVTPADVYRGRHREVLSKKVGIEQLTM
jgi:hypothetical protein